MNEVDTGTFKCRSHKYKDIIAEGIVSFNANVFDEAKDNTLNNTSHVPELCTKLLSIGKITKNAFDVLFQRYNSLVLDTVGNVILIANRVGDLYYVCNKRAYFE